MAKVVLGVGASHGTMLGRPVDIWLSRERRAHDQSREHHYQGRKWNYEELERAREPEQLARFLTHEEMSSRFAACHRAIRVLADEIRQARPDAVVIVGNDHREAFRDVIPAFSVYWGEGVDNAHVPPGDLYSSPDPMTYPGCPALALHILKTLREDRFDITSVTETPLQKDGRRILPHAFAFACRTLMGDAPPPVVPIIQNTFYPPNQPPMSRCIELGRSLHRAIESWDADLRVAVIASGGLSHFIADEKVDRFIIDALLADDIERLCELDESFYQSGTSETKNWAVMATVMRALGKPMQLVDYVACYRSEAGNGQGMAFACWK